MKATPPHDGPTATARAGSPWPALLAVALDAGVGALQQRLQPWRNAGVSPQAAVYIGDDLIDLPVFKKAGVAVAVANALTDVKRAAAWVTQSCGGHGAVREVVDRLLRAQGLYAQTVARYLRPPASQSKPRFSGRG